MFKVGSEPPSSHRWNDTIAPCRALRRQPGPDLPLGAPLLHFWNPLCGISNVFFIHFLQRYKLPAISVAIMRTPERRREERQRWGGKHAECNLVCTLVRFKRWTSVSFSPLFLISRTGFVVWVCVHLCMRSWCICLHGVERKEENLSACVSGGCWKRQGCLFEEACTPVLAHLRFQVQIRKVKKKKKIERKPKSLKQQSAFDRLDGIKKRRERKRMKVRRRRWWRRRRTAGGLHAEAAAGSCCLVFLM